MIKLTNICKNFGQDGNKTFVLKNINLCIKNGEFVAITGQSGSGKSTLMNIIGCLDKPTSGSYEIENNEISKLNQDELSTLRREKFGFIFQKYNLISSLNALENVSLPAIYFGASLQERIKKAKILLSNLNLSDKLKNFPNELSGGQQQRVSIARSLINGAEIILADEPTGALDSKSGENVMDILRNLNRAGYTIIMVTHDQKIANYANRIVEIKDGEILSDNVKNNKIFHLQKEKKLKKSNFDFIRSQFFESFKMALNAIKSHKLRSLLTMLGIIIGIAAVVSVVAIGNGSRQKILDDIQKMGTNTIEIMPGKGFGDMRSGKIKSLTMSDVAILKEQTYIDYVTPRTSTSGTLTYKNLSFSASLSGGNEQSFDVNGQELQKGRLLNDDDVKFSRLVAVIDDNTQKSFFKNKNPIGEIIFFDKIPFQIIGVTKRDEMGFMPSNVLRIFVPYTTSINKISGDRHISSISVRINDNINAQAAEVYLTKLLETKHGKKDFFTRNQDTIQKTVESTMQTMTLLISSISLISLIVGGIGVMNIMLVSVSERTKEIGICMAIGARKTDILSQFLIEAILICLFGGILGILLSFFIGFIFENFIQTFVMKFSITSIFFALFSTAFIGIIFGFMPAKNASELNPIEALNEE